MWGDGPETAKRECRQEGVSPRGSVAKRECRQEGVSPALRHLIITAINGSLTSASPGLCAARRWRPRCSRWEIDPDPPPFVPKHLQTLPPQTNFPPRPVGRIRIPGSVLVCRIQTRIRTFLLKWNFRMIQNLPVPRKLRENRSGSDKSGKSFLTCY